MPFAVLSPTQSLTALSGSVLDPYAILKSLGIRRGMRIADFGCGNGHFTFAAARLVGENGSVYAIDLQRDVLNAIHHEALSQRLANIKTLWADTEAYEGTRIPSDSLDAVFIFSNHVDAEQQSLMLREAARVVRPGGQVLVMDWLDGTTVPFAPAIQFRVPKEISIINGESHDLHFVDEFRPGRYHYGLRFAKA